MNGSGWDWNGRGMEEEWKGREEPQLTSLPLISCGPEAKSSSVCNVRVDADGTGTP